MCAGLQHHGFSTQLLGESSEGCFLQLVIITHSLHSYGDFHAYTSTRKARTFICKPDNSCQGRGIFITHHPDEIKHGERMICQQYISEVLGQSQNTGVEFQLPHSVSIPQAPRVSSGLLESCTQTAGCSTSGTQTKLAPLLSSTGRQSSSSPHPCSCLFPHSPSSSMASSLTCASMCWSRPVTHSGFFSTRRAWPGLPP